MSVPTIAREALKSKIDRGERVVIVETLSAASFARGHLPGAVNLPPEQLSRLAPTLLRDKGAEIVVYCATPT
jgi:rhodanese-related sulfurtransferase